MSVAGTLKEMLLGDAMLVLRSTYADAEPEGFACAINLTPAVEYGCAASACTGKWVSRRCAPALRAGAAAQTLTHVPRPRPEDFWHRLRECRSENGQARTGFCRTRRRRRSTLRCYCYSGAKSWADLLIWAHSPPMGMYTTAIVQGLSIAHGRGGRRQFCPAKAEVISKPLKDTVLEVTLSQG